MDTTTGLILLLRSHYFSYAKSLYSTCCCSENGKLEENDMIQPKEKVQAILLSKYKVIINYDQCSCILLTICMTFFFIKFNNMHDSFNQLICWIYVSFIWLWFYRSYESVRRISFSNSSNLLNGDQFFLFLKKCNCKTSISKSKKI